MKHFRNIRLIALVTVLLFAAVTISVRPLHPALGAQAPQAYVLTTAGEWGPEEDAAVRAAGGGVTFSHSKSGIGMVTSVDPGFLGSALASKKFTDVAPDLDVRWQPQTQTVELNE